MPRGEISLEKGANMLAKSIFSIPTTLLFFLLAASFLFALGPDRPNAIVITSEELKRNFAGYDLYDILLVLSRKPGIILANSSDGERDGFPLKRYPPDIPENVLILIDNTPFKNFPSGSSEIDHLPPLSLVDRITIYSPPLPARFGSYGKVIEVLSRDDLPSDRSDSSLSAQEVDAEILKELRRQIDILAEEIERLKLGEVVEPAYEAQRGLGPAASRVYTLKKPGVSLAGYGEVVYENFVKKRQDGQTANKLDQIDFLRNVVYVGFRFNDWILFNSEIEFEHGSTGKFDLRGRPIGSVSVEFGYVELMLSKAINIRAGMVLPPLGIINEKHEPSTFFGTLRPHVERLIIPSTWRTNGLGLYGELAPGLNYRAYIVEGLNAAGFSDSEGVRGGRQSGAKAVAENFALTGKLEYNGFAGALLGSSFYYGSSGQGATDWQGEITAKTKILCLHGEYGWRSLELRALYAQVDLGDADRLSVLLARTIGSKMRGWYIVAAYDLMPLIAPGSGQAIAPFVQVEQFNTQAEVPSGTMANKANDRSILSMGLSYKPHPNIAFKFDYRQNRNQAKTGVNQWNLAVNYLF